MRVLFFAGREHHVLKTINVFRALANAGVDVLYILSTNSLNLDPSTEYAHKYNVPFSHLYDYLDESAVQEIEKVNEYSQHFSTNPELNDYISPFWISHSIREASETIVLGKRVLQEENPDAFCVMHANNFWARPLLYLAQGMGIKTYAFQEGLLRQRDQETMNKQASAAAYVDNLFTWSRSDASAYVKAGVDESVIKPVGPTHLDQYVHARDNREELQQLRIRVIQTFGLRLNPQRPIITFAPPQLMHYSGDFNEDLVKLAQYCNSTGLQLVVRLHPFDYPYVERVKNVVKNYDTEFFTAADSVPLIAISNLVVSQHSTMAVECLYLGKLFAELDLSNTGILQSFSDRGLAIKIGKGELDKIGEAVSGDPDIDIDKVNSWLQNNAGLVDGRATQRAVNIIRN